MEPSMGVRKSDIMAWTAILAGAAMTSGASPAFGPIFSDILLPGAVLDAVVLSVVYGTCRWIGWPTRSLDLERAGF